LEEITTAVAITEVTVIVADKKALTSAFLSAK